MTGHKNTCHCFDCMKDMLYNSDELELMRLNLVKRKAELDERLEDEE